MKKKRSAILKWLLLAVCLFVAGCFYSCGIRKTEQGPEAVQKNRAFQAESAPESSREITGEGLEYPEDTEAFLENGAAEHTADAKQGKTDSIPENSNMTETALCYVYVCGKVRSPGVYTLPEGARIYEAVDLAGGFTDDAEDSWLNLAEPVTDGMKLEVPSKAQAGAGLAGSKPECVNREQRRGKFCGRAACSGQPQYGFPGGTDDAKGHRDIPGGGYHPLPEGSRRFYKNRRYHEGAGHQGRGLSENKRKYYSIGNR